MAYGFAGAFSGAIVKALNRSGGKWKTCDVAKDIVASILTGEMCMFAYYGLFITGEDITLRQLVMLTAISALCAHMGPRLLYKVEAEILDKIGSSPTRDP